MTKISATDVRDARVTVVLNGDELVLRATPEAILSLSERYDGFKPLFDALQRVSIGAATDIIIAGTGASQKARANIARQVATTGMVDLMPKLAEFVGIVANGGRRSDDSDEEGQPQKRGEERP